MQDSQNTCGISIESFMKLTHQERLDMVHALQNAAWAGRIVMRVSTMRSMSPAALKNTCDYWSQNNKAAARIAYEYLAHGKDVKLPIVPPEWIQAVKDAQPDPE